MKKAAFLTVLIFLFFNTLKANEISKIKSKFLQWELGKGQLDYQNQYISSTYNSLLEYAQKADIFYEKNKFEDNGRNYDFHLKNDINEVKLLFSQILYPLALAYNVPGTNKYSNPYYRNADTRQKLVNTFNYLNAKGWNAKVDMALKRMEAYPEMGYIGIYGSIYMSVSGYVHAVFLMKDILKEEGIFLREMATLNQITKYISPSERIEKVMEIDGFNTDCIRTMLFYRLIYILAQDTTAVDRNANMLFFTEFMNKALRTSNAWADFIKPDFTTYHHRGVYSNAYGPSGLHSGALIAWLLEDTSFQLSETSINNLGNALLTLRVLANKYEIPRGIGGRFPTKLDAIRELLPAYAYMSNIERGKSPLIKKAFSRLYVPEDTTTMAILTNIESRITHFNTLGTMEILKETAEAGYEQEKSPNGFWFKPYGGVAIHRRAEWMVSAKGFSKYIWDFEQGKSENLYGRNSSSGVIRIYANGSPINAHESGFSNEGWDWNRLPGSTTLNLPWHKFPPQNKARRFSPEYFLGGCHINQQNGVFAMKYTDIQSPSEKQLKANKSVFFFEDKVIALGSDIRDGDGKHQVETTIFQTSTSRQSKGPVKFNLKKYNNNKILNTRQAICLTDPCGNSYYIPEPQNLKIFIQEQSSPDHTGKTVNKGVFSTALFNHGTLPDNEEYQYVILIQSPKREVKEFMKKPEKYYEVLQKDATAHIVHYKPLSIKSYVIFEAQKKLNDNTLLSIDTPGFMMIQEVDEGLAISVSNPELGWLKKDQFLYNINDIRSYDIVYADSKVQPITIAIKGSWNLEPSTSAEIVDQTPDKTVIQIKCINGITQQLKLGKNR